MPQAGSLRAGDNPVPVVRVRAMGPQWPGRARSAEAALASLAAPVAQQEPGSRLAAPPDKALAEVRLVVLLKAAAAVKGAEHPSPAARRTETSA
jgi:hypothetical protein